MDGPTLQRAVPSLTLLVLAGAGEIALLAAPATRAMPWWELGSVHAVVIACLGAWSLTRWRSGSDVRLSALGLLGVAVCGPFGAAGACLAFVMHAVQRRSVTDSESGCLASLPAMQEHEADILLRRVVSTPDETPRGNVASFNDVMALGTVEQKRAAISLMTARFRPEFTLPLKRALRDPDGAVRVQAATAVSRLENLFQQRVRELETAVKSGGSDERLSLGSYLDEVAETGLLDESRTSSWRERALSLFQSVEAERPADVALPIGRALVRLGRAQEACDWFDRLPASIPVTAQLLFWSVEAAYRAGRYGQLRALCVRYRDLLNAAGTSAPPSVLAAVALWGVRA